VAKWGSYLRQQRWGAVAYLEKPVSDKALLEAIRAGQKRQTSEAERLGQ
jgi:FixJ family two-component response regulator